MLLLAPLEEDSILRIHNIFSIRFLRWIPACITSDYSTVLFILIIGGRKIWKDENGDYPKFNWVDKKECQN